MKNSIDIASVSPGGNKSEATVKVPGSKSYTNRALIIAALCENPVRIKGPLVSDDTEAMLDCLKQLGIKVDINDTEFNVVGSIADIKSKDYKLNTRQSGITTRFITALSCILTGKQTISGEESLNKRPVGDLVDALRALGADITYLGEKGFPPLRVNSSMLNKSDVSISGGMSSQFLSALLMIAPLVGKDVTINVRGKQISTPYIDMTLDVMQQFGVITDKQDHIAYHISPQKYQAKDYAVEGDFSSAAYFFAVAALNKTSVVVENLKPDSKQADRQFLKILEIMGSTVKASDNAITVKGNGLKPLKVNMENCPDQAMTMAVLAAFSDGQTIIEGIGSLRVKETERIVALENELAKMGIATSSTKDSLTIHGGKPKTALIDTYNDHRLAMAFAVAGTKMSGMTIANPGAVNKTFPDFWNEFACVADVKFSKKQFSNILLIGMRGGGKTTVGKALAKQLNKDFVDMDMYLEEKYGQRVRDIVLEKGWEYFRQIESEACEQISKRTNHVISSGGGIVLDQNNMKLFKPDSACILLKARPSILSRRIKTDKNRPELSTQPSLLGELDEVWQKRKDKYYQNADFIIDTSQEKPAEIVSQIAAKLFKNEPKVCMVIGDPVEHSLSPAIHKYGYEKLGIEDQFNYLVKRVKTDDILEFISRIKAENMRGVSLTMPHKELVIPFLDQIDPTAKKIGAVNTIVNENGRLTGYNTDWIGAIRPLENVTDLKDKKVAVIGAGGTAKAFVYGLMQAGCDVTIYNRTLDKAKELADAFGCKYAGLDELDSISKTDIICNTSSAGMNEDKSPINSSLIKSGQIVFDAVYTPLQTRLLKDAKARDAITVSGIELLLNQAFAQFELFTGQKAPEKYIRRAIMEKINER